MKPNAAPGRPLRFRTGIVPVQAAVRQTRPAMAALLAWGILLLAACPPAMAFSLGMPLRCEYGRDCFIQNYVDTDPSENFQDFRCGGLSYDGHTGTDFFVLPVIYKRGVDVVAAADGIVQAVRDGMEDVNVRISRHSVGGREAGNAVAVTHDGGWETRYNHLRRGSVAVRTGDHVEAGQVLGTVGLSGMTEFPHLELVVTHDGEVVDPFTGRAPGGGCAEGGASLWNHSASAVLGYIATGSIGAGFTDSRTDVSSVRTGFEPAHLHSRSDAVIFWGTLFGTRKGDVEIVVLYGPRGRILARRKDVLEKPQVRRMRSIGILRGKGRTWETGVYRGEYLLYRRQNGQLQRVGIASAETRID